MVQVHLLVALDLDQVHHYPQFWRSAGAINSSVANDFKHGSATNYAFYDGVNNFSDFARGENYTSTEKALHKLINIMAMKTSHC